MPTWKQAIEKLKETKLFGGALKKDGLPGFGTIVGVITTPLPIAGCFALRYAKSISISSPVVGDLHKLDNTALEVLGNVMIVLTWLRYHPAVCRRIFLSLAAFLHNTRWEVKPEQSQSAQNDLQHQSSITDLDLNHLGARDYDPDSTQPLPLPTSEEIAWCDAIASKLKAFAVYLIDCPNRFLMIRINTLLMPILMLTFVSTRGHKGSIPGFADTTELPDWIRYILQIEFGFHFGQAFTDRSIAALDIVTAKKNLFVWLKDCIGKIPQYREKSFQENWLAFKTLRFKIMQNAGFYRSIGAFAGVFSGAILATAGFATHYFANNNTDEKLKGFGNIENLGGHNELIALALFYVTTSCGPRIGECIDDCFVVHKRRTTGHVAKNFYRALFSLILVPLFVMAILFLAIFYREHDWRVDLFKDPQELSDPIFFAILVSTAFNFVLPLATRFFGPLGDYIGYDEILAWLMTMLSLPMHACHSSLTQATESNPPEPSPPFTPGFNQYRQSTPTEHITIEMSQLSLESPTNDCTPVDSQLNSRLQNLQIN